MKPISFIAAMSMLASAVILKASPFEIFEFTMLTFFIVEGVELLHEGKSFTDYRD